MNKPRFNYTKMRRTFYAWHGGQNSQLYAAASSGLVDDIGALQRELRACAETMWNDRGNFRFFGISQRQAGGEKTFTQSSMKAKPYAEWKYLRRVADALPEILSAPAVHPFDGKTYQSLPWAKVEW